MCRRETFVTCKINWALERIDAGYLPPSFNPSTGAPAMLAQLAFGSYSIKQRLGFSYEVNVDRI
jgi:hypothetical protein